jgi:hypothetical protein
VSRILRVSLGPVALDKSLLRGQFRQLDDGQIGSLLSPPAAATDQHQDEESD